jgi:hypothetical protein
MAAPKNNRNASKWNAILVRSFLKDITAIARGPNEFFLGSILDRLGLYRDVWVYWRRKFSYDDDLMNEMDLIKDRFEVNIFRAGCEGKISAAFAIMNLKANYGWRENPIKENARPPIQASICEPPIDISSQAA